MKASRIHIGRSAGLSSPHSRHLHASGLTLIEIVIALAIVSILISIALPTYQDHRRKVEQQIAEADINEICDRILTYTLEMALLPESLQDVAMAEKLDPWGNPYRYLRIDNGDAEGSDEGKGKGGVGKLRKDKNLVPINTDYDLYSMGRDGKSVSPLTAKHSRDDIIRANDGRYVGVAKYY